MAKVTISEDYTIEIPEDVRERMDIAPGQKFEMIAEGDEMYLVRVPALSELRGIARGANAAGYREKEERL